MSVSCVFVGRVTDPAIYLIVTMLGHFSPRGVTRPTSFIIGNSLSKMPFRVLDIGHSSFFFCHLLSAFAISTYPTDGAATFVFYNTATIRACSFKKFALLMLHLASIGLYVGLDGAGHRVGAG